MDILIGGAISWAVSGLKRFPLAKNHPRIVTFGLSTLIPCVISGIKVYNGQDLSQVSDVAIQIGTQFAAAIATHETVTHTINDHIL